LPSLTSPFAASQLMTPRARRSSAMQQSHDWPRLTKRVRRWRPLQYIS
jgi:hypothetical protein